MPERLHAKGRPVMLVESNDRLYIHVPAVEPSSIYGFDIEGFRYVNQSANSEKLNIGGCPTDVLRNVKEGGWLEGREIACIPVRELRNLKFPNPNVVKLGKDGAELPVPNEELYRFDVHHEPEPCMYPHCEIGTYQGDERKSKLNSNEVKSLIRRAFAKIADKYRTEMLAIMSGQGVQRGDHSRETI